MMARLSTMPMNRDAIRAPAEGAQAADDDDHEDDGAELEGHGRLGAEHVAADDPGDAGQRRAEAERPHEDRGHVVAQGGDDVGMAQRRPDDQPDRVRVSNMKSATKMPTDMTSVNSR